MNLRIRGVVRRKEEGDDGLRKGNGRRIRRREICIKGEYCKLKKRRWGEFVILNEEE
jgi:hypothetical protein